MSLSFEEYSALRRRRGEGEVNDVPEDDGAPPAPPAPEAEAQPRISSVHNAGYFFETPEVQLLTLLLIVFDVAAAISSMLITCGGYPDSGILRAVLNMIEVSERDPSRLMRTPVAACYNSLATDPSNCAVLNGFYDLLLPPRDFRPLAGLPPVVFHKPR